jgi:hypothetical protein
MMKPERKSKNRHRMLGGDDAKQYLAEDEFDLKKLVNVLVETLTHRIDADGYVLGIEGSWGSGKSSFVNFVANEIRDKAPKHRVIQFQPWLIGARDALLAAFFAQFAAVIDDIPSSGLSRRAAETGGALNQEWTSRLAYRIQIASAPRLHLATFKKPETRNGLRVRRVATVRRVAYPLGEVAAPRQKMQHESLNPNGMKCLS